MIHPATELRHAGHGIGHGVFALEPIPRGTVTWVLDALDRVFPPAAKEAFPPIYQPLLDKYTYRDAAGGFILCWDHARFMNHHCDPACVGTRFGFEVAARDLAEGDELTVDYATLNLLPHEAFECLCGGRECRRSVGAEDAARLAGQWDAALGRALARVTEVPQPLLPILGEERLWQPFRELGLPVPPSRPS